MSDDSADNEADQNESRGAVGRIIKAVRSLGSSLDEVQRANPAGSRATPQIEVTASEAFRRLLNGNERFCREAAFHPRSDVHYAQTLAIGQRPFAVVVSDADARMCPEESLIRA